MFETEAIFDAVALYPASAAGASNQSPEVISVYYRLHERERDARTVPPPNHRFLCWVRIRERPVWLNNLPNNRILGGFSNIAHKAGPQRCN